MTPRRVGRTGTAALVAAACGMLGACAKMEPGLGFDDVQRDVSRRAGARLHWDNGTEEDREARDAVRGLLAKELSADGAVQVALLNNRSLQATYEELNLAQADVVQAGLLKNPVFSGEVRFSAQTGSPAVVLDMATDFVSLLFMPMRTAAAQANFEAAKTRVTIAVLDHAAQTRAAYYQLQGAMAMLELRRTAAEATGAAYDLAQRLHAAGNNRELDVAHQRAVYEQAKLDLADAEAQVDARREDLSELMGVWGSDLGWTIATRLPELPVEEVAVEGLERRAIEKSLDLAADRAAVEIAAREVGIASPLTLLDGMQVGVGVEREFGAGWDAGPAIQLPIPLFDQGQATGGAAAARLAAAGDRYIADAVTVRSRTRAAYTALRAARQRAAYYQKVMLPLRQHIVEQTLLQYNAAQMSAFELLSARRDQAEAGAAYIQSLRDYWLARGRLELILAGRALQGGPAGGQVGADKEDRP